jgi:hypothetical protein
MIELNNKHIVLIFIIIIIGVFIYNYDVYVIPKNEPICKPIYVTKREISPEIRAELNKSESEVLKETFTGLSKGGYLEEFKDGNLEGFDNSNGSNYDIPPKSFSTFTIPSITNKHKLKVIESVIKILSYIPTNYCETQIKQLVEYFAILYETSPDLETFYKNVSVSTKIKDPPYNSKYSHLILFLIGKFDNDYATCSISQEQNEKYAMNELLINIIKKNYNTDSTQTNDSNNLDSSKNQLLQSQQNQVSNVSTNQLLQAQEALQNEQIQSSKSLSESDNYLSEQLNEMITTNVISPENLKSILKKTQSSTGKSGTSSSANQKNTILPNNNNKSTTSSYSNPIFSRNEGSNYLQEQYPILSSVPTYSDPSNNQYPNNKQIGLSKPSNSGNTQCSYKCDSTYSKAISYLDSELKPLESFGNISSDYAPF